MFRRALIALIVLFSHLAEAQSWQIGINGPTSGFTHLLKRSNGDLFGVTVKSELIFSPAFRIDYTTEVYKSTDQGASFSPVVTGLLPGIQQIVAFGEYDGVIYIVAKTGFGADPIPDWIARSSDNGATWSTSGAGQLVRPDEFLKEGSTLYARSSTLNNSVSTDEGITWTEDSTPYSYPDYSTVGSRRFYRSAAGLQYSDDLGVTRNTVFPGKNPNGEIVEFSGMLFTHSKTQIPLYRSADNGLTWETLASLPGFPDHRIGSLFPFDGRLFAATSNQFSGQQGGLFFTEDGESWAPLTLSSPPASFSQAFPLGNYIIVRDGGVCVRALLSSPTGPPIFITPPQDATVGIGTRHTLSFYATGQGPLSYQWYSGTSGDTSSPIAGATGSFYKTDPLAASADFWVRISGSADTIDSNTIAITAIEIWTDLTASLDSGFFNIIGPFSTPSGLTVIRVPANEFDTSTVYQSSNNGDTWTPSTGPNGISNQFFYPLSQTRYTGGAFFSMRNLSVGDTNPKFATSANGIDWTPLNGTFSTDTQPAEIIREGDNLYIADKRGAFYFSSDNGATFSQRINGLTGTSATGLARTSNGNLVLSMSNRAVYTSTDNGLNWTQRYFVGTDTRSSVSDLRELDGVLYATLEREFSFSQGRGLWKSTDEGVTWSQVAYPSTELESVTLADGKLIVSSKTAPPAITASSDGGVTFEPLTNTGLGTINPFKLVSHGGYVFLSDKQRLLRLRVADAGGEQVTITTQPQGTAITTGNSVTLTVEISGEGTVTYQWYRGLPGIAASPVGTNSPSFTTDPSIDDDASYFVAVTNGFGDPVISDVATISILQPPSIAVDHRDVAIFTGATTTFGPRFSLLTPLDTVYQWYLGESGDTSNPIGGATTSKIGPPTISPGERVWLRATANGTTVDSAAASLIAISATGGTLDLISRDPDGRTWDEGANSHLSENGQFAFFGSQDPNEGNSRHPLPYVAPQFIDETPGGEFGFGNSDDISNTGRYLLFSRGWVHDMVTNASSATFNTIGGGDFSTVQAWQISTSGRYVVFGSSDSNLIPNDDNGHFDIFLHDRVTGGVQGLTRFADGSGNQTVNATYGNAEIDALEESVFFSHFATDPLIPGENSNLYIYDIASSSLSVPTPLKGKGPYASFADASSNGRYLLFSWNPVLQALRPTEPIDYSSPRQWLYVYDRQEDELNFVDIPFGAEYTRDHTISNDGRTVSFIHSVGSSIIPYISHSASASGPWATKLLIDPPTPSTNTADLRMSDDGSSFIYSTLVWSLQTPQYSTGAAGETNEVNVMYLSGVSFGTAPAVPSFADWSNTELAAYPSNQRGENDDADGDGVANIIAYLSGRTAASPRGPALTTSIAPIGAITITFRQRAGTTNQLIPEFSSDLGATGWDDIRSMETNRVEVEPGVWEVTVTAPAGVPSDPKFFRLSTTP